MLRVECEAEWPPTASDPQYRSICLNAVACPSVKNQEGESAPPNAVVNLTNALTLPLQQWTKQSKIPLALFQFHRPFQVMVNYAVFSLRTPKELQFL
jgi:hypothetical protein